jgi:hypothetical protein
MSCRGYKNPENIRSRSARHQIQEVVLLLGPSLLQPLLTCVLTELSKEKTLPGQQRSE